MTKELAEKYNVQTHILDEDEASGEDDLGYFVNVFKAVEFLPQYRENPFHAVGELTQVSEWLITTYPNLYAIWVQSRTTLLEREIKRLDGMPKLSVAPFEKPLYESSEDLWRLAQQVYLFPENW